MKDFILSFFLLVIFSPLVLCIAVVSFCIFGKDLFFCTERLGFRRKKFILFKFRSMQNWSDEQMSEYFSTHPEMEKQWKEARKMHPDPRCSKWGSFLRRFSLDELPQLFNVLRGEMALVGPRPIVEDEARLYGKYCNRLHRVKPGLTGLWQVSGRCELSYHRRIAINLYYVRHKSWKLDLWIMFKTVWAVVGGRGAY